MTKLSPAEAAAKTVKTRAAAVVVPHLNAVIDAIKADATLAPKAILKQLTEKKKAIVTELKALSHE